MFSAGVDWEPGCQKTAHGRSVVNRCQVRNQVCILRESTDTGLSSDLLTGIRGGFNELI